MVSNEGYRTLLLICPSKDWRPESLQSGINTACCSECYIGTGDCVSSERELLGLGATLVGDGKPESLANAQGR